MERPRGERAGAIELEDATGTVTAVLHGKFTDLAPVIRRSWRAWRFYLEAGEDPGHPGQLEWRVQYGDIIAEWEYMADCLEGIRYALHRIDAAKHPSVAASLRSAAASVKERALSSRAEAIEWRWLRDVAANIP